MNAWIRAATRMALIVIPACGSGGIAAAAPEEPTLSSAAAAPESWLRRGAPVRARVGTEAAWTRGRFDHMGGDSLYLWEVAGAADSRAADSRLVSIPVPAIRQLELGRERVPNTWRGFAIGLLVVGTAGAVALATDDDVSNKVAGAAFGFGVFGGLGGLIGALVGSSAPTDHWVAATVPERRDTEVGHVPDSREEDRSATMGGVR